MKNQIPVEIHTHTNHSDAVFTLEDLIEASINFGYKGIILTDHNTSASYYAFKEKYPEKIDDLVVLKGIEWTTYFGHMLVHDAAYDIDWRDATPDNIDDYMTEVKEADGLVGIAHPYDMGSPICTGCHWDFEVKDYNLVDHIEVWNSNSPQSKLESKKAYQLWVKKLLEGYRISASSGRDWHSNDDPSENMGVTYLELKDSELTEANFKEALKKGNFYITLGPRVEFLLSNPDGEFYMGDTISLNRTSDLNVSFHIKPTEIEDLKKFSALDLTFQLWNNDKIIYSQAFDGTFNESVLKKEALNGKLEKGFLRYEVVGTYKSEPDRKLVIGNPIYIL